MLAEFKPPCCLSAGPDTPEALVAGLQGATLLMMAVPFTLVALGVLWFIRSEAAGSVELEATPTGMS